MLYLLLAIFSSATIAVVMRISSRYVKADNTMLAANYVTCLALAALYAGKQLLGPLSASTVGMGLMNGGLYLLGFVLLQYNTKKSGVVLSSVFMKLGLLVPIALSVLVFGEKLTAAQGIGFSLALAAVVLINYEKGTSLSGVKLPLLVMLLACGSGDAMSKVFEMYGPVGYGDQFLLYTFASALLLCLVLVLVKKERPERQALLFGVLVGVPNFFSAKFLLMALSHLPAVIVYPTFSVATVLVVTLAGTCLFQERLRKSQWIALAGILVALALLNI